MKTTHQNSAETPAELADRQFVRVRLCNACTTRSGEKPTLLRRNYEATIPSLPAPRHLLHTFDAQTGKQASLGTRDRSEALELFCAKNQAHRQVHRNLRLARTYLTATDPLVDKRNWQMVMEELAKSKRGTWGERWQRAIKDKSFDCLRDLPILETLAEHFLKVLQIGTVSTNVYLRRIHNFALDMGWLPCPVFPKRQWPAVRYKEKRAITREEHLAILLRERNDERRAFYELCWHLGGSQSDIAALKAEDIDWDDQVVSFFRKKTKSVQIVHFGNEVAAIFQRLPNQGPLFSNFGLLDEKHRASWFQMICRRVGIQSVSLHSYRYAWAEHAKIVGYPERFAQEALGHNSKAVHRAYARKAQVKLPSLETFERQWILFAAGKAVEAVTQPVIVQGERYATAGN